MHLCAVKLQDSIPSSPSRNIRHYFYRYVEEKLRAAVRIFVTVPNWLKDRL
jgi:cupin superfamily acireductone dioxygenase involved in methionine salvage